MVGIEALGAKAPGWAELIKIPVEIIIAQGAAVSEISNRGLQIPIVYIFSADHGCHGGSMPTFSAKPTELNAQSAMGPVSTGKATKGLRPQIYAARCQRCDGKGWVEAAN
jgi:hypothetical protein